MSDKVSRTTVRKAIQNLAERGLVEVRRGKGTFVTQPKITQELTELTGFVEDMQALGANPDGPLAGQAYRGSGRSRSTLARIGAWDVGGQASACSLGRWCGDVFRRDVFASSDAARLPGRRLMQIFLKNRQISASFGLTRKTARALNHRGNCERRAVTARRR